MGILLYVKLHPIHLFFGFQIFFVLHETPHLEIPIFHNSDSLYKNEIHQYTHILDYQQYKRNICEIRFYFFLNLSSNFGLNIGFVHSISCACKTLFIIFSLTFTPKLSFNILTKEANVSFLSLNKTPSINPINFSFSFGFLPNPSRLFPHALSSLYIFFIL